MILARCVLSLVYSVSLQDIVKNVWKSGTKLNKRLMTWGNDTVWSFMPSGGPQGPETPSTEPQKAKAHTNAEHWRVEREHKMATWRNMITT